MNKVLEDSRVFFSVCLLTTAIFWVGAIISIILDSSRLYYLVVPIVMTVAVVAIVRRRSQTKGKG